MYDTYFFPCSSGTPMTMGSFALLWLRVLLIPAFVVMMSLWGTAAWLLRLFTGTYVLEWNDL